MKNLIAISIITVFFITISASNLLAQGNPSRTSGARAAYGYPAEVATIKKKKKKQRKEPKRKEPKRKAKTPINKNRNKNPWVN